MALRFFLWGKKTPKQTTRLIRLFSFNVQIISGPIYNHIIHDMTSKKQNKLLFFLHTTFSCGSMTRIILILSCVKLFGFARCSLGFIQRAPVCLFLVFHFQQLWIVPEPILNGAVKTLQTTDWPERTITCATQTSCTPTANWDSDFFFYSLDPDV